MGKARLELIGEQDGKEVVISQHVLPNKGIVNIGRSIQHSEDKKNDIDLNGPAVRLVARDHCAIFRTGKTPEREYVIIHESEHQLYRTYVNGVNIGREKDKDSEGAGDGIEVLKDGDMISLGRADVQFNYRFRTGEGE